MPHDLPFLDRLTVGAIGQPGERAFFLQAGQGERLLTFKIEKTQVAALAQYLGRLLGSISRPGQVPEAPELDPADPPEWAVGTLGLSYDAETDRVLLVIEQAVGEDESGETARLGATREQAAALAIRGTQLVEAGRPPCPLCGYPLDPSGHACPRTNGHRPPKL
ncbi:MAG: DUF3090 family protein [Acidimicrobiales bacterium]